MFIFNVIRSANYFKIAFIGIRSVTKFMIPTIRSHGLLCHLCSNEQHGFFQGGGCETRRGDSEQYCPTNQS
ncbi:hypothetical protein MCP1_510014 [Candidatus Terasakiella magnetica]|nr:hypothetical protein MCP1_510014 [Candidatus Terasakiella magnetica]